MFGSDNVCYVYKNEGLSAFDSGITFTKSQAGSGGESSNLSRCCAICSGPLTRRQARCCSLKCGRDYARSFSRLRDQRGAKNPAWKGGVSKQPIRYTRAFKQANPEKVRAQNAVVSALRNGMLVRPSCCASCLRDCRPDAHHWDYTKPLRVEWLCRKCHVAADRLRRQRDLVAPTATTEQSNCDAHIAGEQAQDVVVHGETLRAVPNARPSQPVDIKRMD